LGIDKQLEVACLVLKYSLQSCDMFSLSNKHKVQLLYSHVNQFILH